MPKVITYSITSILLLGAIFAYFMAVQPWDAKGSVIQGNEYHSTSTALSNVYGARTDVEGLLKTGHGSLAQVTITGAGTGTINFYNATTTDVTQRAASKATTTILIASFPASTAAGTYVFDATVTDGLIYSVVEGNIPTTTIMWR